MSYNSLGCRRGSQSADNARARDVAVEAHVGSRADFVDRLERAATNAAQGTGRAEYMAKVFTWAIDTRNLATAWEYLQAGDGHAPGSDGLRYSDFDSDLMWCYLRDLHEEIANGDYEPWPLLRKEIPKGPGRTRVLELPTIAERTVGRAMVQAIQPYLDPHFSDQSYGYRPGRDHRQALAHAEALARSGDRWVWVTEDIRDAFPNVPRTRLLDIVQQKIGNEKLVQLMDQLLANGRKRGIPQGQALCPLLLNVYLDHLLDKPWRKIHSDLPLLRVADDLLVLCRDRADAEAARADLDRLLRPAGMPLKGSPETAIRDLRTGQTANWLGFQLQQDDNRLQFTLGDKSWEKLEDRLALLHTKPNAPIRATQTLESWIKQMGPAYPAAISDDTAVEPASRSDLTAPSAQSSATANQIVARARALAVRYGFLEVPSDENLCRSHQEAYAKWKRIRATMLEQHGCSESASSKRKQTVVYGRRVDRRKPTARGSYRSSRSSMRAGCYGSSSPRSRNRSGYARRPNPSARHGFSHRFQTNGTGFYGSCRSPNDRGCYGRNDPKSADRHKCRQPLTGRGYGYGVKPRSISGHSGQPSPDASKPVPTLWRKAEMALGAEYAETPASGDMATAAMDSVQVLYATGDKERAYGRKGIYLTETAIYVAIPTAIYRTIFPRKGTAPEATQALRAMSAMEAGTLVPTEVSLVTFGERLRHTPRKSDDPSRAGDRHNGPCTAGSLTLQHFPARHTGSEQPPLPTNPQWRTRQPSNFMYLDVTALEWARLRQQHATTAPPCFITFTKFYLKRNLSWQTNKLVLGKTNGP